MFVNCAGSSGRFTISNTACLFIKGLHFVGCGGSTVSQVEDLVVEDTIFEGVEERGTALTIVGVSFAIIARSSFLFKSHLNNNSEDLIQTTIKNDLDFFVNYYLEQNVSFSTGGTLFVANSNVVIESSTFWKNKAELGGVLFAHNSSISLFSSTFSYNNAEDGAVMATSQSSLDVKNCNFSGNVAEYFGGVMLSYKDSYTITSTNCQNNSAGSTGGVVDANHSFFNITDSSFTDNFAEDDGGVIYILDSSFNMSGIICRNNAVYGCGGVVFSDASNYHIVSSIFYNNSASFGGVFEMYRASVYLVNCTFTYNNARNDSGVIWCVDGSVGIDSSRFSWNRADEFGGIMVTSNCSIHAADTIFDNNLGSMYGKLTFRGHTNFKHCSESPNKIVSKDLTAYQEGGAITSFKSTIAFIDTSSLTNNQARHGGAILTTDSTIIIYGNIRIANNTAISGSGGGISLCQSNLKITGHCYITHNKATRGGGIHVHSSYVTVYQPAVLDFINNSAINGGAICLEVNPKLYLLKNLQYPSNDKLLSFISNNANYGGAVYVEDNTNLDACLSNRDCFIQALTDAPDITDLQSHMNIIFSENTATERGSNLFGGLLDRCVPSAFAELSRTLREEYNGIAYLTNTSNLALNSAASLPV